MTERRGGGRYRRFRRAILARDVTCTEDGCRNAAAELHHDPALVDGGRELYSDDARGVCRPCHKRLTGELTRPPRLALRAAQPTRRPRQDWTAEGVGGRHHNRHSRARARHRPRRRHPPSPPRPPQLTLQGTTEPRDRVLAVRLRVEAARDHKPSYEDAELIARYEASGACRTGQYRGEESSAFIDRARWHESSHSDR
jgi:hypothetical protein